MTEDRLTIPRDDLDRYPPATYEAPIDAGETRIQYDPDGAVYLSADDAIDAARGHWPKWSEDARWAIEYWPPAGRWRVICARTGRDIHLS